jgi:regulator of sirC expression with transglutaminase-like and TPR domain
VRAFDRDIHFSRLVHGQTDAVDLATVALEIARDEYPELDIPSWLSRLDSLGRQLRSRVSATAEPETLIAQLNEFLFAEQGFRGNEQDYYDPRNSFLNDVIERKLGIPITLSLVYLAVAERVGLPLRGVGMPAHFIVKFAGPAREIFIDPFHGGAILTRESCERRVSQVLGLPVSLDPEQLDPSPPDQVVLRLLANLKGIYVNQSDAARALRVQERIFALNESDAAERRDLGALYLRNDRPAAAIEHLEAYRRARPDADDSETVHSLLKAAARMLAAMN